AEIKLAMDDHTTRTIPMTQVKSVSYEDATAAQAAAVTPPPAAGSAPPAAGAPAAPPDGSAPPAAAAAPDPVHDQHYHPPAPAVTTKTSLVPAGTSLWVRCEETIDSAKA